MNAPEAIQPLLRVPGMRLLFSAYLLICACVERLLILCPGAITFYMDRRLSSLCSASRYKTLVFSLPFHLRMSGGYSASALAPGTATLHTKTFNMHRRLSSLCPGSRYKTHVYNLPSHLRMRGGYPASAMAPDIRLLFTAYLFICTCVEAIQPLSWLQV